MFFSSERRKWRKQAAASRSSLAALDGDLRTEAARTLVEVYCQHLDGLDGNGIPGKDSFKFWLLRGGLEYSILYDFAGRDDLVYRVVGEAIKARFGFNPDGHSYLEFVAPERKPSALEAFRHCADTPCAMHVSIRQQFESGRQALCEVVGVPLGEEDADRRARYLLFVDQLVEDAAIRNVDRGVMRYAQIDRRCFVDIGFGVPDDFHDLVPR